MTDQQRIRDALDDLTKALNDPDADYTEEEIAEITALQEELKARLQLTEQENPQ